MGFNSLLGIQVERPAGAIALVGTPGDPYFTIAGGLVLIRGLMGIATIACAGANTLSFELNPDAAGGVTSELCNTADLGTADGIADVAVVVGAPATAILGGVVPMNVLGSTSGFGIICMPGVIGLVATAALGTYRWILWYVPIDVGATVVIVP